MKKVLMLALCLSSLLIVNAQNFASTKFPQSGKKKQIITCRTVDGSEMLKLYAVYLNDKINKKKVKSLKLNGEKYQIELKKGTKKVYDQERQLIAEISKDGDIHLFKDNTTYFLEQSRSNKMIFHNIFNEEAVVITYQKRKSLVQVNHVNTPSNQLFAALCFNEFVDKKIREPRQGWDLLSSVLLLF